MKEFLLVLVCLWQKVVEAWSDDDPYDPTWMDQTAWQITRI